MASHQTSMHCACRFFLKKIGCATRRGIAKCPPPPKYATALHVPPFRLLTVGRRLFPVAASILWNSLRFNVQSSPSLPVFRQLLETSSRSHFLRYCYDICLPTVLCFRGLRNSFAILTTLTNSDWHWHCGVPWLATSHAISKNHWFFSAIDLPPSSSCKYALSVQFFDCEVSRLSRLLPLDMFCFTWYHALQQ